MACPLCGKEVEIKKNHANMPKYTCRSCCGSAQNVNTEWGLKIVLDRIEEYEKISQQKQELAPPPSPVAEPAKPKSEWDEIIDA